MLRLGTTINSEDDLNNQINLYFCNMCKEKLITGVKVTQQMSKARAILKNQVIPQEELFQQRKESGRLSPELMSAIKKNA